MVKTICTTTPRDVRMKPGIRQIWELTKNHETIRKPNLKPHPPQVWRDKIASLKYSRDLCPLDHRIADCKSPPLTEDGLTVKVEGLDHDKKVGSHLGCDQKDAKAQTERRLIIRFRITAEGKAQRIPHALNFDKVPQDSQKPLHHGIHKSGDKAERAASLVKEICKEMMKEDEIKRRERFRIMAPQWKRICKVKVSLVAPRLCAR